MKIYKILFILIVLCCMLTNNLLAKDLEVKKENFIQTALATYENDSVLTNRDQYYTNGVNLLFTTRNTITSKQNKFLTDFFRMKDIQFYNYSFGIGQKIYTSEDIENPNLSKQDRPYAGYLYLFLNKNIKFDNKIDTFGISAGLTGPNSLGEKVQKEVHNLIGSPRPQGWDYQLENEFLFMASWMRTIEFNETEKNIYDWNLITKFITNLGTPFTNFNPSVEFRYGWNLDKDFVSNKIQTTSLGVYKDSKYGFNGWSYYFFLELGANFVLYNTFLDGNISGVKPDIDKNWFCYEVMGGLAMRLKNFYIKYSNNYLSKEFKEQDKPQFIFSLSAGYLF